MTARQVISNMLDKGELIGVLGSAGHLPALASGAMDETYEIPAQFPGGTYC